MVVLLCTSTLGPAVVAGTATPNGPIQEERTGNDVTVTTGARLSPSSLQRATTRSDFENAAFDERVERRNVAFARPRSPIDRAAVPELTSAGTDALFRQFTGETGGNAVIEIDGGVSIEAEPGVPMRTSSSSSPTIRTRSPNRSSMPTLHRPTTGEPAAIERPRVPRARPDSRCYSCRPGPRPCRWPRSPAG